MEESFLHIRKSQSSFTVCPLRNVLERITFAHAFANPSKVTYFSPEMLNTCLLAFSLPST